MLYGCETWAVNVKDVRRLKAVEMKMLRYFPHEKATNKWSSERFDAVWRHSRRPGEKKDCNGTVMWWEKMTAKWSWRWSSMSKERRRKEGRWKDGLMANEERTERRRMEKPERMEKVDLWGWLPLAGKPALKPTAAAEAIHWLIWGHFVSYKYSFHQSVRLKPVLWVFALF